MQSSIAKRLATILAGLVIVASVMFGTSSPASATAQTCIGVIRGYVCTIVYGSGTRVDTIGVSHGSITAGPICNYNAWFYYIPPSGGAYGLGTVGRQGCTVGRAWLDMGVNRSFARGTQMCAKFYVNYWQELVGQKCVGIS